MKSNRTKLKNIFQKYFEYISFVQFSSVFQKGMNSKLDIEDLPNRPTDELASKQGETFKVYFQKYKSKKKKNPLFYILLKQHQLLILLSVLFVFIHSFFNTFSPYLLKLILVFFSDPTVSAQHGYKLAISLLLSGIFAWTALHLCFQTGWRIALKIKSSLNVVVYEKILKLDFNNQANLNSGEVINLIASDTQKIAIGFQCLNYLILSITVIFTSMFMLYEIIGVACFSGIATLLAFLICSNLYAKKLEKSIGRLTQLGDSRLGVVVEILNGIRTIKNYLWEGVFFEKVNKIRKNEISGLRDYSWQTAVLNFIFMASPIFVTIVTFSTYLALGHRLLISDIFPTLAILGLLRSPILAFPAIWINLMDSFVSCTRVFKFLNSEETRSNADQNAKRGEIIFENAEFERMGQKLFTNVNIDFSPGELSFIVGRTGAGTSTFLNSIIEELPLIQGRLSRLGKISFVSQQTWILNRSFRDNIILDEAFDPVLFEKVLKMTLLFDEVQAFIEKDLTKVGERGQSLSGGQRQRLCIARALYQQAEIYIFDDSLSALDRSVADYIFNEVIIKFLHGKTRLFVSNNLDYLPRCQSAVLIEDCQIVEKVNISEQAFKVTKVYSVLEQFRLGDYFKSSNDGASSVLKEESTTKDLATEVTDSSEAKMLQPTKGLDRNTYLNYFSFFGSFRVGTILLCYFFIVEVLGVTINYWLAESSYWAQKSTFYFLGVLVCLGGLTAILVFIRAIFLMRCGLSAAEKLHSVLLEKVLNAKLSFFEDNSFGKILSRFSQDMISIDQHLSENLLEMMTTLFMLITPLVVILFTMPATVLVLVPFLYFYWRIQLRYRATSRQVKRIESETRAPVLSNATEALAGISSIKAFQKQNFFISDHCRSIDVNLRAQYNIFGFEDWLGLRLDLIAVVVLSITAMVAIYYRGQISVAMAGMAISYAMLFTASLARGIRNFSNFENEMIHVERVLDYAKLETEKSVESKVEILEPQTKGKIEFKNVSLRYRPNQKESLSNINLIFLPGKKIGVIGRTGSGKSSLFSCLLRLVDLSHGEILIDERNIKNIPLDQLRSIITVVSQDPILFKGTLRFNLDPMRLVDDEKLWLTLEKLYLSKRFKDLPEKLDTEIEENSRNFSVGEKQMICLARALLRQARIFLVDEATANVDSMSGRSMHKTIAKEFSSSTLITISHQIEPLLDSDFILEMDNGRILSFHDIQTFKKLRQFT